MSRFILFISLSALLIGGALIFPINSDECEQESIETEETPFPNLSFFKDRNYPDIGLDLDYYYKVLGQVKDELSFRTNGEWINQGPGNIGARVNTIAIEPGNDQVMYAGFSHGGIFKTTDKGENWFPVFDNEITLAISDIEIDPSDPNRIFAGTGDKNISGYPFAGTGLYVSLDGGINWESSGLTETGIITNIKVSSGDPDLVYAASMGVPYVRNEHRGLYRSQDGGVNWEQILYLSDSTGIIDLIIHPEDDQVIYVASWDRIRTNYESFVIGEGAAIYKSVDGGDSWNTLQSGLPEVPFSRISLHMDKENPDILIAGFVSNADTTVCQSTGYQLYGIYRSDNAGESWSKVPSGEINGLDCGALGGFGWYFEPVRVNPKNPNDIFVLGVDLWRTLDGGENWYKASPPWWQYSVHADKHDLVFNSSNEMILGTDGGIYRSPVDTEDWIDIENISTTQFYRIAYNPHQPDRYYGGAQDNGTTSGNVDGILEWDRIYGGDGFQMVFHPDNPDIFYVETQNGNIRVTTDGGNDFMNATKGLDGGSSRNWDMPYIMSKYNPDVLYAGTYRVFKNSTGPDEQWDPISEDLTKGEDLAGGRYPNITTIAESPLSPGELYAGTNDGNVWASTDDGKTWNLCEGLPERYVTDIKASPFWPGWVYACFSGYRDNDNTSHVYLSKDYGQTWESLQGDLLDLAVNDIYILENNFDNHLIIGTDAGVYISQNAGLNWERLGNNMPIVPVYDLEYNPVKNEIIAGTYARGIYSFSLDQLDIDTEPSSTTNLDKSLKFRILPSITSSGFTISLGSQLTDEEIQFKIFDSRGKILNIGTLNTDCYIDISSFPAGQYYIQLADSKIGKVLKVN